jgi:general secretion pathway protein D
MKIKPHISGDDVVRLELEQEIKDIGDRDAQLGPTWTTRKIKTNVVVRDQQSVVIGGLMQDRVIYNESKIPYLGDIPLLGYLFKYTSKTKKKTNLLVVLTPYVIRDQFDLQTILERKFRERAEFIRSFRNLNEENYLPKMDYRRKRGLLEEINRSVMAVEVEAQQLKDFEKRGAEIPDGPVKYDEVQAPSADDGGDPMPADGKVDDGSKPGAADEADKAKADKADKAKADKAKADKAKADKAKADKAKAVTPAAGGQGQ